MCGIAGMLLAEGCVAERFAAAERCVAQAMRALAHRGPDDQGMYSDSTRGILLAHTRLSIIDPSPLGHQPMLTEARDIALAYNGEIYNYRELRARLTGEGVQFVGDSDTEVALRLYAQQRPSSDADLASFLRMLNGMFAMAIWDDQRRELILARDALGVKPLYYLEQPGSLAFASELKALLPLAAQQPALDRVAVNQYLSFLWSPGSRTAWLQARKVEPGELIRATPDGRVTRVKWYRSPAGVSRAVRRPSGAVPSDAAALIRRAVHRQMVADVPVGAFLSGGLDSTSVVSFAREADPTIRCFTIDHAGDNDPGFVNDLPYARLVARELGVHLTTVTVNADNLVQDLEEMIWQLDEPLADPAPLNVLHICRAARECGIKVLLSGVGCDDLFSGYRRHLAVMHERYWSWLPGPVRKGLRRLSRTLDARPALGRRIRRAFAGAHLSGDDRLVHYFRWIDREDLAPLYSREMRAAVAGTPPEQPMLDHLAGVPGDLPRLERMLSLEQRFFLADHNLTYTDKMSMAAGVEVRVPLLDMELVEFAASVPTRCKLRRNSLKWIMTKAMEPHVPREAIHRPKSGFGAPLGRWIRHELREWVGDMLSDATLRRRGLFDPAAVRSLIARNQDGSIYAPYTILSLACIEAWCRRFIDRGPVTSVVPPRVAAQSRD